MLVMVEVVNIGGVLFGYNLVIRYLINGKWEIISIEVIFLLVNVCK